MTKINVKGRAKTHRGIVKVINRVLVDNLGARMTKRTQVRFTL